MSTKTNEALIVGAAEHGNSGRLRSLLKAGFSPNASAPCVKYSAVTAIDGTALPAETWGGGGTAVMALQAAAAGGHQEATEVLIIAGALVNAPGANFLGRTALQGAAENGHEKIVKLLLAAKADVNAWASLEFGKTALQAAAGGGYNEIVHLLLLAKADVNAPASFHHGGTALQAAAGGGHMAIVELLLEYGADVNAPASNFGGRAALHAAAGSGRDDIVKVLLRRGADVNASGYNGETALWAAAEGGHGGIVNLLLEYGADANGQKQRWRTALQEASWIGRDDIVKVLLGHGADVNAEEPSGKTALWAAAKGGHGGIVKLLLGANADVNVQPKYDKRTALRVAAEKGHKGVVKLLLLAEIKADASTLASVAPATTSLQAAAENGHDEIVDLLLLAANEESVKTAPYDQKCGEALAAAVMGGSEVVAKHLLDFVANAANLAWHGKPMIHHAASSKAIGILKLLISRGANCKLPDSSGETVLHKAVISADINWLNSLVDLGVFDINATNPRGQTPLRLALETRPDNVDEICASLLARGASTEDLSVDILPWAGGDHEVVFLQQNQGGEMSFRWGPPSYSLMQSGEGPSVCLLHLESRARNDAPSFFHPGTYISDSRAGGIIFPEAEAVVGFRWKHGDHGGYNPGVPTLIDGGFEGWLIGYVCFSSFVRGHDGDAMTPWFEVTDRKIGISWIMTNYYSGSGGSAMLGKPLRSVHYRGSLTRLSIPAHCVEYFTWFLRDVRQNWEELFSQSRSHLDDRYRALLSARGENPTLMPSLFEDARQWSTFRTRLHLQMSKSRELQKDFECNAAFYDEVLNVERKSQANQAAPTGQSVFFRGSQDRDTQGLWHKPRAIIELVGLIEEMEKTLSDRISDLESRTHQIIDMEFNLVSIYEARKSIEMSASMKRLSWITFIFLPLMFSSSLFGMNVDVLKADPSWTWYPTFAIPFLIFVFCVWVAFKCSGIENWIERNIRRYPESKSGSRRGSAPGSSTLEAGRGSGRSPFKGWPKRRRPQLGQTHIV